MLSAHAPNAVARSWELLHVVDPGLVQPVQFAWARTLNAIGQARVAIAYVGALNNRLLGAAGGKGPEFRLKLVHYRRPSAYSAMVELNSTHFGIFWESKNYGAISFLPLPYD